MGQADQVVIATAMPLVGYRVLEALQQAPGLPIHGPVRTVDQAVQFGGQGHATLYICDAQALVMRLRWVVCGTDLVDPAHLVFAGALWQPGMPVNLLLAEAWQGLSNR